MQRPLSEAYESDMMSPDELLEMLASTRFADREHVRLDRGDGIAVALQIDPSEARDAWFEARTMLDASGRWPIAITTWPQTSPISWTAATQTLLDPRGFGGDVRMPADAIIHEAAQFDLNAALERLEDETWHEWCAEEMSGEVAWAAGEMEYWFEPDPDQPTAMVFLPSSAPWTSVAYESWYASQVPEVPDTLLVALLERWYQAYGAEPMAHWGTMLQFRVARPPTDIDRARALAREQLLVAPCTAMLPNTHPEMHAHGLLQAKTWFLHERADRKNKASCGSIDAPPSDAS